MSDNVPVVLVVDLDPDTHAVAEGALPENECALVSARSPEIALKMAERRPPSVLVIGDRIQGLAYLSERLRRLTPHLHVLLLTSQDQPQEPNPFSAPDPAAARASQRAAGVGSVLRKPVDVGRFRSTLRTALRLAAMAAGVNRMRGTSESGSMPRITPIPAMTPNPKRENK